jgi:hypothetical protein
MVKFKRGASTFFTDQEIKAFVKQLLFEEMRDLMREERNREIKWLRDTASTVPERNKIIWWQTSRGKVPVFTHIEDLDDFRLYD